MAAYATDAQLVMMLRTDIATVGSLRAWAKDNDFSASYISDVLNGRRNISERLALTMGFERPRAWVKVGADA